MAFRDFPSHSPSDTLWCLANLTVGSIAALLQLKRDKTTIKCPSPCFWVVSVLLHCLQSSVQHTPPDCRHINSWGTCDEFRSICCKFVDTFLLSNYLNFHLTETWRNIFEEMFLTEKNGISNPLAVSSVKKRIMMGAKQECHRVLAVIIWSIITMCEHFIIWYYICFSHLKRDLICILKKYTALSSILRSRKEIFLFFSTWTLKS